MTHLDDQRRYNQSAKGRERAARYRQRHRARTRAADVRRLRTRRAATVARLQALKVEIGCIDCGYNAHPRALDFDHVTDQKVSDVGRLAHAAVAWERIEAEIAKCEVRCANCHRIRTAERQDVERAELDAHQPTLFDLEAP